MLFGLGFDLQPKGINERVPKKMNVATDFGLKPLGTICLKKLYFIEVKL
jgi:hypothetical protein